jgi:hypothetical protein
VQDIIGILDPFGNSFQGQNVAKIIVAKKAGGVRLIDFRYKQPWRIRAVLRARQGRCAFLITPQCRGQTLAAIA